MQTKHNDSGRKTITAGKRPKIVQAAGVEVFIPPGNQVGLHLPPGCRPVIKTVADVAQPPINVEQSA